MSQIFMSHSFIPALIYGLKVNGDRIANGKFLRFAYGYRRD